jgi:NADPH:quinone reductase-like Zn-dependent oxidoreductase
MAQRIESGEIQMVIDHTFSLEKVNEVLAYRLQTREPGKVVLVLD